MLTSLTSLCLSLSNLSAIPHLISGQLGRHKQTVPGRVIEAVRDDQALFIFISS